MLFRQFFALILFCLATGLLFSSDALSVGYPHFSGKDIECNSCHSLHGGFGYDILLPSWIGDYEQSTKEDTPRNILCRHCHNDTDAPSVMTHSYLRTSDRYGEWMVECWVCHDTHVYEQADPYTDPDNYIFEGQATDFDISGSPVTVTVSGAGWSEDGFKGAVFFPDKNLLLPADVSHGPPRYKILSNTTDTLYIEGPVGAGEIDTGNTFVISYSKLVRKSIDLENIVDPQVPANKTGIKPVTFVRPEGTDSYADGTGAGDTDYTGICEVCHTETNYHKNDGSGAYHDHGPPKANCVAKCHTHKNGFMHGSGSGGCAECHGHDEGSNYDIDMAAPVDLDPESSNMGAGSSWSHSTHTEFDADDKVGPQIYCDTCHDITDMPRFKNQDGTGDHSLAETDICNNCHSPGGTYDGVNDPVIGAKANWTDGVYDTGRVLKTGKEKWCAGCHDEEAGNSRADDSGIAAPNIIGDEDGDYNYGVGWGYFKTGHGLPGAENYPSKGGLETLAGRPIYCDSCHDFSRVHIDHNARTFDCSDSCDSSEYQDSYRLVSVGGQTPMEVPWPWSASIDNDESKYRLCASCHDTEPSDPFTDGSNMNTNMRKDTGGGVYVNYHNHHLDLKETRYRADYDYSSGDNSQITCVICHNVHGSQRLAMIRDGKLIGREPGLEIWYTATGITETYPFADPEPQDLPLSVSDGKFWRGDSAGNLCTHCHGGDRTGSRDPYQDEQIAPELNWTGESGFTNDGAYPDSAVSGSLFTFRISYTDNNNDPPAPIQLWIDLNDDEDFDDPGEKLDMSSAESGDSYYYDGKLYTLTLEIHSVGGDDVVDYLFYGSDWTDLATGVHGVQKTITLEPVVNNPPELTWVTGDCREKGVSPYTAVGGSVFTFYVQYSDADDDAPSQIEVWVDLNDDGDFDDTVGGIPEKQAMTVDGGDGDYTNGENYTKAFSIDYAGDGKLDYRFVASDGTDTAIGEPTTDSPVKVIDTSDTIMTVCPVGHAQAPCDYQTIQAAVDAYNNFDPKTILVYQGTYNEQVNFNCKSPSNDHNTMVRSACGPDYTTLDGTSIGTLVTSTWTCNGSGIDGFEVTNGTTAISVNNAGLIVDNCRIHGNSVRGISFLDDTSPKDTPLTISNSEIYENPAPPATATVNGAGIYIKNGSNPAHSITDSVIRDHETSGNGGAVYLDLNASLNITGTSIEDNTAAFGGGIYIRSSNSLTLSKTQILGNIATSDGGAIYMSDSNTLDVENCIVADNQAVDGGGFRINGSLDIVNSTVSNNSATGNGGAFRMRDGSGGPVSVRNSILWGNATDPVGGGHIAYLNSETTFTVEDSIVSHAGGLYFDRYPYFEWKDNNRGTLTFSGFISGDDPLFVDAANRNYHIQDISPAIDNAKPEYAPNDDVDDEVRPQKAGYDIGADEVPGVFTGNNIPILKWTGDTGFESDGVNPDSGACGTSFEFRVNYTDADDEEPSLIEVWVDLNDDGDYEDTGEKETMVLVGDGDGDFTNGENYTKSMVLESGQDGSINYTFRASDGTDDAFGSPTNEVIVTVTSPTVTLTSVDQIIDESGIGSGEAVVTLELSAASNCDVTVPFTILGTASGSGTDYANTTNPVTITAGGTTGNITFTTVVDTLDEDDETIEVTMGNPVNADQGAVTQNTVTITDDDDQPTVGFTSASQSSGESGSVIITAELSTASGKNVSVPFSVNAGSTTEDPDDYAISSSPLSISAGSLNATITVTIAADTTDEYDETVIVDMGSPTNATQGAITTHTVTITDDDDPPTIGFTTASQATGSESGTPTITASLSEASGKDITVPFTVNAGSTADDPDDYAISSSPLTISAGNPSADITVTIVSDSSVEGDETVIVDMGTPVNATQGAITTHTLTITDDDVPLAGPVYICNDPPTCADIDYYNTIQEGINAAGGVSPGTTVMVTDGVYSENIDFSGKNITVQSVGGATVTKIEGSATYNTNPVVNFGNSETSAAILDGFTLDNQQSTSTSRGIYISGAVPTIRNSIIEGNNASNCGTAGACGGGGIYIDNSAPTFDNCTIRANVADNRYGCGIYITGDAGGATILNSTIGGSALADGNTCANTGAGAGIYYTGSSTGTLEISGSTIQNNAGNNLGGGIHLSGITYATIITGSAVTDNQTSSSGAGIYSLNSPLIITDTNIDGNESLHYGGGLYLNGEDADAVISGGSINDNLSTSTSDGHAAGVYMINGSDLTYTNGSINGNIAGGNLGGGIYVVSADSELTLTNVFVQGNKIKQHGGGIYLVSGSSSVITNSVVTGNAAGTGTWEDGGGIFSNGALEVYSSTIAGNYAGQGGGVHIAGGTATITNSILWDNTSGSGTSDEIFGSPTVSYSDIEGGFSGTGNLNLDPVFVTPAQAGSGAPTVLGDFHIQSTSNVIDQGTYTNAPTNDIDDQPRPLGSGIDMGADEFANVIYVTKTDDTRDGTCDADCSLREAVDATNAATEPVLVSIPAGTYNITRIGNDGTNENGDFDVSASAGFSGAGEASTVIVGTSGDRVFEDVAVGVNLAFSNLTIKDGSYAGANGGCLYVAGARLTINDIAFDNCDALNGGAVFADSSSVVAVTDSTFTYCDATNVGGAMRIYGGTITDSTFTLNTASTTNLYSGGGAVFTSGSPLYITGSSNSFTDNSAVNQNGGAILSQSALYVSGATFDNNTANGSGGAIYNRNGTTCCTTEVTDSVFSGNEASTSFAGAIYSRKDVIMTTSTFMDNISQQERGGVAFTSGIAKADRSTFKNNIAYGDGGALWGEGLALYNSTFSDNTSYEFVPSTTNSRGGAVFHNGGSGCSIKNTTFFGNSAIDNADSLRSSSCTVRNTIFDNSSTTTANNNNNCNSVTLNRANSIENNISGIDSCGLGQSDPMLATLSDNGGPTETHALQSGSAAIDTGDNAICSDTDINNIDQRGVARPVNGGVSDTCDIGAFEYVP